jgi:sulfonate transport system substrate-binding protein
VRTGKVDAAPFVQPFAGRAQDAGGIRKLFSLSEVQSPLVHIFEGCEKGFSDKNPELVRLYIRDLTKAMDILKKDRSLAVDVNVEVMRAPRPALDRYVFTDQDMGHTDGSAPRLDVIAQSFALYREAGFITKPLSIDDFVRRDLLAPIR